MNNTDFFSFNRVLAVIWRVLKQITRDRRTLGMIIVMPALIMFIFGFALGGEAKNVPILVDNQDNGFVVGDNLDNKISFYFGNNITESLLSDNRVKITLDTFESGKCGVDNGKYFAAFLIPPEFSEIAYKNSLTSATAQLCKVLVLVDNNSSFYQIIISNLLQSAMTNSTQNNNATIFAYFDGTKPVIQASVLAAIQSVMQNSFGSNGIILDKEYAFDDIEYSGLDVSIPSVIAFVLTFLVMLISLIIITREATSGVLTRLYTTPLSAIERLLGYSGALIILAMVMAAVILGIGIGIFGVIVQGNLALLFAGAVLYGLTHVFLAVFLSNFARNELQAVQMAPLIALPSMALSGMLIPINTFPEWVQVIAKFVPMYYGNQIFEGIMLKGYGITELAFQFIIVGAIALLFLVLAIITVKDRIT